MAKKKTVGDVNLPAAGAEAQPAVAPPVQAAPVQAPQPVPDAPAPAGPAAVPAVPDDWEEWTAEHASFYWSRLDNLDRQTVAKHRPLANWWQRRRADWEKIPVDLRGKWEDACRAGSGQVAGRTPQRINTLIRLVPYWDACGIASCRSLREAESRVVAQMKALGLLKEQSGGKKKKKPSERLTNYEVKALEEVAQKTGLQTTRAVLLAFFDELATQGVGFTGFHKVKGQIGVTGSATVVVGGVMDAAAPPAPAA